MPDATFAIDKKRCRYRFYTTKLLRDGLVSHHNGIVHFVLIHELFHDGRALAIERNAYNNEPGLAIFFVEVDVAGNFSATGTAPRRPEIEHNYFDLKVCGGEFLAIYIAKLPGRRQR